MQNIRPDYLIERKRNKNQLLKWKIGAIILGSLFLLKLKIPSFNLSSDTDKNKNYIASIKIQDIILDDMERIRKLKKLEEDDKVKAVIVNINSPGGTVVGSEMLYDALRRISNKKPVVTLMGSVAASGGYLTALGGDYIIAHNGTITGSIGVIMQSAEVTELAEKIGIKFENFKSNKLKASPNPMEKLTPEAREVTMQTVNEVYDYFAELVAKRRNLDLQYVRKIADGRVYSARRAKELKLIDAIGNEDAALKWLQKTKNIDKSLEIVDYRLKKKERLFELLLEDLEGKIFGVFSKIKSLQSIM